MESFSERIGTGQEALSGRINCPAVVVPTRSVTSALEWTRSVTTAVTARRRRISRSTASVIRTTVRPKMTEIVLVVTSCGWRRRIRCVVRLLTEMRHRIRRRRKVDCVGKHVASRIASATLLTETIALRRIRIVHRIPRHLHLDCESQKGENSTVARISGKPNHSSMKQATDE